jgi:hypothetical protein
MAQTVNDFSEYLVHITQEWDPGVTSSVDPDYTPYFNSIDQELTISVIDLELVEKFTTFTFSSDGILGTRYLDTYYRVSRNGNTWTEWFELEEEINNFPPMDPLDPMLIDIKFIRKGTKSDGSIRLFSFSLDGTLYRGEEDGTVIIPSGGKRIIRAPYVYKVFRIDDIEIISPNDLDSIDVKYRFSQDNTRTWSQWEPLTKENISTVRINPIRFFHIEYLVENLTSSPIKVTDINLIGDFQNVSKDYLKTNLYGIRECCQSSILGVSGADASTLGGDDCQSEGLPQLTDEDKENLYNPYQQTQAMDLFNKLSTDAMAMFGHRIQYFVTDPDGNGIDHSLNEFQLYNVVCYDEIKATVENNQFPDNQIVMNQFDLTLFDSFEIQITKQDFKKVFGVQRRPSKEDIVWFCDINRIFIVDHAQQFRNFNNAAVYYKVILKKYNNRANVAPGSQAIEDVIKQLTKNTTIDELFGIEVKQDKDGVANKKEQQTLTRDPIRLEFSAEIIKELIENSSTVISKQHYDFSSLLTDGFITLTQSVPAVTYKNIPNRLSVSDNIGYMIWFRINNYIDDEVYNLFNFYDSVNNLGWKLNLENDVITFDLNSDSYQFDFGTGGVDSLSEDVWYCYVMNVDQRQRTLDQWIYKRNVDDDDEDLARDLNSTNLRLVYTYSVTIDPSEYELESIDGQILSSDMKVTNIRLFKDIIPQVDHNSILNQYIIGDDAKFMVFADNANTRIILDNFPYGTKDN